MQQSGKVNHILETRANFSAEVRGDSKKVEGYAAVYNCWSEDLGGFIESIVPGAFTRTLASGRDIRCLFDHSSSKILGRQSAKTLNIYADSKGLGFECQLGNSSHANDVRDMLTRGDIKECSFGFTMDWEGGGDEWLPPENAQAPCRRILRSVNLYEVSVVTFPAYPDTSAALRSLAMSNGRKYRAILSALGLNRR